MWRLFFVLYMRRRRREKELEREISYEVFDSFLGFVFILFEVWLFFLF